MREGGREGGREGHGKSEILSVAFTKREALPYILRQRLEGEGGWEGGREGGREENKVLLSPKKTFPTHPTI